MIQLRLAIRHCLVEGSVDKPMKSLTVLPMIGLLLPAGSPTAHGSTVIAFDSAANTTCSCGTSSFSNCGLVSWSHTIGSGSYPVLIVGVSTASDWTDVVSVWYRSNSCSGSYCDHQLSYLCSLLWPAVDLSVYYLWGAN